MIHKFSRFDTIECTEIIRRLLCLSLKLSNDYSELEFCFAINYLIIPNHLYEGGTGVTSLYYYLFKIPVSLMDLINILFSLLLGKFWIAAFVPSILGTFAVSAWLAVFEKSLS